MWQGRQWGLLAPWGRGCSLRAARTQQTSGCAEACQCRQLHPGTAADSKTGAETPRRSAALLTTASHQHRLQPRDTPNMKQWESPAPAGIHRAGPFAERVLTEQGSYHATPEAISEYF